MTLKRTALVTGANKGIGREISRQLGRLGYTVWLGARDEDRGRETEAALRADGVDAHFVQLDVTSEESVRAAVSLVEARSSQLDVLVNNAGVGSGLASPTSTESVADIQALFEVNFFGTVRVTQAFLPLVRKSAGARIVMLSSGLGSIALTGDSTFTKGYQTPSNISHSPRGLAPGVALRMLSKLKDL